MIKRDDFLYFTYNGKHSSEFGVFYENNGEDISFPFSSNFKFEELSPLFQNMSYLVGGKRDAKSFSLNLYAENDNWFETEEIFRWLNPEKKGELIIDYRPNYIYETQVSNISEPVLIPFEDREGKITNLISFSITFKTYGAHLAKLKSEFTTKEEWSSSGKIWSEPDFGFPLMESAMKGVYNFYNWTSNNQHIQLEGKKTINFQVKKEDNEGENIYYSHKITVNPPEFFIDTELGAMVMKNEQGERKLLESQYSSSAAILNKGPMPIKPGVVFTGELNVNAEGSIFRVKLNKDLLDSFKKSKNFIAVLNPGKSESPVILSDAKISTNGDSIEFRKASQSFYSGKYNIHIAAASRITVLGPHEVNYIYKKGL